MHNNIGGTMKSFKILSFCMLILTFYIYPAFTQEIHTLMVKADSAYDAYDNKAALELYSKILELDEQNYEASWKLSRAYVDVGETFTNKEERKSYYLKGADHARKAVEIDSNGAKGHLYLSIAIGRVAIDAGSKEKIRLSKEIKAEVDKALAIDPNDDIAWHVLGRWHRKMATLNWVQKGFANLFLGGVPKEASVEKAAECFQKSIEINPYHINHHLELGITYQKLKQKEKAKTEFDKVIELPEADSDDAKHKKEAEKRLQKLK